MQALQNFDHSDISFYVAVNEKLRELTNIINHKNVTYVYFSKKKLLKLLGLLIKSRDFDYILFSPHAQKYYSSLYLPLLFRLFQSSKSKLIGGDKQKLSWLFDKAIDVNMTQSIYQREYLFLKSTDLFTIKPAKKNYPFFKKIYNQDKNSKKNLNIKKIFFHIGASVKNRRFSDSYLIMLLDNLLLNTTYMVIIIGLPDEINFLKNYYRNKKFKNLIINSYSLKKSIALMYDSDIIITMDSGFGHIAAAIDKAHICIIGPASPNLVEPFSLNSKILYQQNIYCQPCNKKVCYQKENYCLTNINFNTIVKIVDKNFNSMSDV